MIGGKAESLQIVLDWDRTITTSSSESSYGVLEEHQDEELKQHCRRLFAKYWPIEQSPTMTIEEKTPHMLEWYKTANALFISAGFTRNQVREACLVANCALRPEFPELVALAESNDIPVLIFSAGVKDSIVELLRQKLPGNRIPSNLHVVSNEMIFEEGDAGNEKLVGWSEETIFMYNKNESHLRSSPIYPELCRRKNVLLAGDSLGDTTMATGLPHAEKGVFKVGIVNHVGHKAKAYVDKYLQSFDAVMVDGWTLRPVLDTLKATLECSAGKRTAGDIASQLISQWKEQAAEAAYLLAMPAQAEEAASPPPQIPLTGTRPLPSAAEQAAAHHQ